MKEEGEVRGMEEKLGSLPQSATITNNVQEDFETTRKKTQLRSLGNAGLAVVYIVRLQLCDKTSKQRELLRGRSC